MLKPRVEVATEHGVMVAEFWDCLRLDPAPVKDLRAKYEAHLKSGGLPVLVVDLNGITFAGSSSLGGFLALHKVAKGAGGRLIFCNVDANVFEVFRVSKLDPFFTFVPDVAAARAIAEAAGKPAGHSEQTPMSSLNDAAGQADRKPPAGDANASLRRGRRKPLD
ncbi:STAS domain-containing protein [Isosphaeraceae bacterium EP7]